MSELPSGWTRCSVLDVLTKIKNGLALPQNKEGQGIPVTRIETIASGKIDPSRIGFIDIDAESEETHRIEYGDILFSHINSLAHIGKTAIYKGSPTVLFHGTNLLLLRSFPGVCDPRFIEYALRTMRILGIFSLNAQNAVNQASINQKQLGAFEFRLAPTNEQKRIADKLDSLLARVDACRERLDRVPGILKRFRQAVLAAATSGELTREWRETIGETNQWSTVELESVASDFSYGTAAKSLKAGKIPVLRMGNIQDGVLDWSDLVYTSNDSEIRKYKLHSGDVLFNRTNSPELVGKTAVYHGERDAIYAGYLIRVRCGTRLLPDFLNYCLGSPAGRDYCWQVKSDGVSQSNINARKLAAFSFGLPTVPEQVEIVRRVGSLFEIANLFERRHAEASQQIRRLTPSILAKAFRGELVPQDPNDEPASELLARIRDRDSSVVSKKPARSKVNDRQI